jgi:hypothetical protein
MASTKQDFTATQIRTLLDLERAFDNGATISPPMNDVFTRLRASFYRAIPYDVYLLTHHWERTRALALRAFGARCRYCDGKFSDDAPIHIHHLTYERLGHERLTDLIPLCAPCHERWHREERNEHA